MADGFIVRKGGVTEEVLRTAVPSINFISATTTSLTFTFKNNEDAEVDLFFGITTPPTTKITLAANATSSNQTITGLNDTDTFDVFAYAIVTDPLSKKIKSEIVETQAQTLIPTPTITQVSKTDTSITFTVRNNSRVAADVLYDLVTPPVETTLQLAANTTSANQTISGLADNTTFTVFAQTKVAGFADSAIASSSVTTNLTITFNAATGGTTQEYNSGGARFKSHTFNSSGTFTVTTVGDAAGDRNKVDYLIIAGGAGGAGRFVSGGGGAGGYRTTNGTSGANTSAESKVTVTAQGYTITVGAGGAAGISDNRGGQGVNSSAFNITSTGGGGGGGYRSAQSVGGNGGSGGGGGPANNAGGAGTAGQGRNGGTGVTNTNDTGGGGGGASGVGSNSSGTTAAIGFGGNGLSNTIRTGSAETRAGGGGGSSHPNPSAGGTGGGGTGGGDSVAATAGAANTGSGGGGGRNNEQKPGGSGIVVIRYEIATV